MQNAITVPHYPARPTVYKGIRMRSRLEALVAAELDRGEIPWVYEPECFADETGQYLPDFLVGESTYVEVKPRITTFEQEEEAQKRMEIILSSYPDASLVVWITDGDIVSQSSNYGEGWEFDYER